MFLHLEQRRSPGVRRSIQRTCQWVLIEFIEPLVSSYRTDMSTPPVTNPATPARPGTTAAPAGQRLIASMFPTTPASGPGTAAPAASNETAAPAAAAGESTQPKKKKKKSAPVPAHRWSGKDPPSIVCEIMKESKGPGVDLQSVYPMDSIGCLIAQVQQECEGNEALIGSIGIPCCRTHRCLVVGAQALAVRAMHCTVHVPRAWERDKAHCLKVLVFWKKHKDNVKLQTFVKVMQLLAIIPTSSAAAERVFSRLRQMFDDGQPRTLADKLQLALMLVENDRTV